MGFLELVGVGSTLVALGVSLYGLVFRPFYTRKSVDVHGTGATLLSDEVHEQLSITFAGRPAPRVTKSLLRLVNGGRVTVLAEDVRGAGLMFRHLEGELLEGPDATANLPRVRPSAERRADGAMGFTLVLRFDVLEPGDSVEVSYLHSGSALVPDEFEGHIAGTKGVEFLTDEKSILQGQNRRLSIARNLLATMTLALVTGGATGATQLFLERQATDAALTQIAEDLEVASETQREAADDAVQSSSGGGLEPDPVVVSVDLSDGEDGDEFHRKVQRAIDEALGEVGRAPEEVGLYLAFGRGDGVAEGVERSSSFVDFAEQVALFGEPAPPSRAYFTGGSPGIELEMYLLIAP
ncbi:MAG: hypothetical protein AAGA65_19825 [Actinomycetota bacterium]